MRTDALYCAHFEPSLHALNPRSDVITSMIFFSIVRTSPTPGPAAPNSSIQSYTPSDLRQSVPCATRPAIESTSIYADPTALPYPTLPYPALTFPDLPYPTLPHHTLTYPTLPYPALPFSTAPAGRHRMSSSESPPCPPPLPPLPPPSVNLATPSAAAAPSPSKDPPPPPRLQRGSVQPRGPALTSLQAAQG